MQSTGIGSWEYRKGFLGSGMSTIPFQAVYEIPLEHAKEQMQILRRTTSTLPMNTGHFTAPLQGARLILGLVPRTALRLSWAIILRPLRGVFLPCGMFISGVTRRRGSSCS